MLINEEFAEGGSVRVLARDLAFVAIGVMAVLVLYAVVYLRERPEFQHRQQSGPLRAVRDIWGNPHARLLITVTFIENVGSAAIAALTLYVSQYVVGAPAIAPLIILAYAGAFLTLCSDLDPAVQTLWQDQSVDGGHGADRSVLWRNVFFTLYRKLGSAFVLIIFLAVFAGLANGCGVTLGPSVQGDVDYDEYKTGERKEGSYFAAWNFVYKKRVRGDVAAYGLRVGLRGFRAECPSKPCRLNWPWSVFTDSSLLCAISSVRSYSTTSRWTKKPIG